MGGTSVRPELIAAAAEELASLPRGERGARVARYADIWGLSTSRVRALVRQHRRSGLAPKRKRVSELVTPEQVKVLAELLGHRNRWGDSTASVKKAIQIGQACRLLPKPWDVSVATVYRALRAARMSKTDLTAREPSVVRRSLHANHVHMIDFSPCAQWYLPSEDEEARYLRPHEVPRKPESWGKRQHLWRYLGVDHCSGYVFPHYFYARGENAEDLLGFLWRFWSKKEHAADPMHGVPRVVSADKGAPFRAQAIVSLLRRLGVETIDLHQAGNAKASGAVERAHSIWEGEFEELLRHSPARSLAELNQRARSFAVVWNRTAVHSRHGMTRLAKWQEITHQQLRTLPVEREDFNRLATRNPETRRVDAYLVIRWHKMELPLEGNVRPDETVTVIESPWAEQAVRVFNEQGEELVVKDSYRDENGFLVGPHTATWGEYAAHKVPPAQALRGEVEEGSTRDRFRDAFRDVDEQAAEFNVTAFPGPVGMPAIPPEELDSPPLGSIELRMAAVQRLRRGLTADEATWLNDRAEEGVTADQLDDLFSRLAQAV